MLNVHGYCILYGDYFSPMQFEANSGYRLSQKIEPGQIGTLGKYKGAPYPYGSGNLEFENVNESRELFAVDPRVIDLLLSRREWLVQLGVTDIRIHFDVEYEGQCNLELSCPHIGLLARLGIPVTITCYQVDCQEKVAGTNGMDFSNNR
jgi:hypothetical protein